MERLSKYEKFFNTLKKNGFDPDNLELSISKKVDEKVSSIERKLVSTYSKNFFKMALKSKLFTPKEKLLIKEHIVDKGIEMSSLNEEWKWLTDVGKKIRKAFGDAYDWIANKIAWVRKGISEVIQGVKKLATKLISGIMWALTNGLKKMSSILGVDSVVSEIEKELNLAVKPVKESSFVDAMKQAKATGKSTVKKELSVEDEKKLNYEKDKSIHKSLDKKEPEKESSNIGTEFAALNASFKYLLSKEPNQEFSPEMTKKINSAEVDSDELVRKAESDLAQDAENISDDKSEKSKNESKKHPKDIFYTFYLIGEGAESGDKKVRTWVEYLFDQKPLEKGSNIKQKLGWGFKLMMNILFACLNLPLFFMKILIRDFSEVGFASFSWVVSYLGGPPNKTTGMVKEAAGGVEIKKGRGGHPYYTFPIMSRIVAKVLGVAVDVAMVGGYGSAAFAKFTGHYKKDDAGNYLMEKGKKVFEEGKLSPVAAYLKEMVTGHGSFINECFGWMGLAKDWIAKIISKIFSWLDKKYIYPIKLVLTLLCLGYCIYELAPKFKAFVTPATAHH
jgi:hypothetical protein